MGRVKSFTSPKVILWLLVGSTAVSVAAVPFWDTILVTGTTIWASNTDDVRNLYVSMFCSP